VPRVTETKFNDAMADMVRPASATDGLLGSRLRAQEAAGNGA
jgi:hypothetical protein